MSWKAEYIILILISTSIDYYAGIKIESALTGRQKKYYLYFSLLANLGILVAFKYFNFITENILGIFTSDNEFKVTDLLLPVGISFYTFQSLSYTIDVYRNTIKAEKNFIKFALYVSFFPQLVAGPIERAKDLIVQFNRKVNFDYKRITHGLKLMFWGFFQKVAIADNIARLVDAVYNNPENYFGWNIILIAFLFAIQIYSDFSGYTDIARGAAKIMGFDLMINFKRPYFAKSIREFWQRWHISLSTWFRDYLYFSLGGNRTNKYKWFWTILITFALSGLWHGARWTFVIWGLYHALLYLIGFLLSKWKLVLKVRETPFFKLLRILSVFCFVVFGFMIFRAKSLSDLYILISNVFSDELFSFHLAFDKKVVIQNLLAGMIILVVWLIERKRNIVEYISGLNTYVRWAIYFSAVFYIIGFGHWGKQEFIYFQF